MSVNNENNESENPFDPMEELTHEERTLIVLREELYDGSWEAMENDLQNRLEGEPYIFKLQNRIEDDIERIDRLKELEDQKDLDLGDYLEHFEDS